MEGPASTDGAAAPAIRLRSAGRRFNGHEALAGLDLEIRVGERVAILGSSGAGKTTLIGLLNGSLAPTSGTVEVLGHRLAELPPARQRKVQARIGTVGQRLDLIEQVRVLHNLNAGRLARWGTWKSLMSLAWTRPDAEAHEALDRVGLGWAIHEHTARLSGGERQRVAIARLLLQQPELVLADEPVSSLDPVRAAETLSLIQSAGQTLSTSVISLHQPALAREHCSRAIGLRGGRIVFDVATEQLDDGLLDELYGLV